jgi:Putative beta-barrel porin-2, OmpL-like. bbp2
MFTLSKYTIVLLFLFSWIRLFGQDTTPTLDTTVTKNGFNFSGSADAYYRVSSNKTESTTHFPTLKNGLGWGWVNLTTEWHHNRWHALLDLSTGQRTKAFAFTDKWHHIFQQYTLSYEVNNALKLTAGNFYFPFNYEWAYPGTNQTYSYSILYSVIPVGYDGIKADWTISDKWSAYTAIYSDPNVRFSKFHPHPTAGIAYIGEQFSGYMNFLTGKDFDTLSNTSIEFIGQYQFNEKITGVFDFQWYTAKTKNETPSKFKALVGYLTYNFSDKYALTARGEWFNDSNGLFFGQAENNIYAFTLSPRAKFGNFIIQPEFRLDTGSKNFLPTTTANNFTNRESNFLLAIIYKFGSYPQ